MRFWCLKRHVPQVLDNCLRFRRSVWKIAAPRADGGRPVMAEAGGIFSLSIVLSVAWQKQACVQANETMDPPNESLDADSRCTAFERDHILGKE